MRRLVLGLWLCLCGCAQRDNPWDPVNVSGATSNTDTTKPQATTPVPGATSKVVLHDSASRDPSNPYFANLASAIASLDPGDTLWIQGNRSYVLSDGLQMAFGGSAYNWIVIRSFGGTARLVDGRTGTISSLLTLTGSGYVELRGLAFVRSLGAGFRANGLQGPLKIDSCRFDSNGTYGIETRGLRDTLFLRDLLLRANRNRPPISVETPVDSLRVRFQ